MKKPYTLAFVPFFSLVFAQQDNIQLNKDLENQQSETLSQFELYVQKFHAKQTKLEKRTNRKQQSQKIQKNIDKERKRISFFFKGEPYFTTEFDDDQILNANVETLHNGSVIGLNDSYKGKNIHISVFDGGRTYEKHEDFGGPNNSRVTYKDANNIVYDNHATAVTSMIGGRGISSRTATINGVRYTATSKGMVSEATFDSYSFENSILPGESSTKNVRQKLLTSLANISNHSYGMELGWQWLTNGDRGEGWYYWGEVNSIFGSRADKNLYGTYNIIDKEYDDIVYNNPQMIVVKAAGNSFGNGPDRDYDKKYRRAFGSFSKFTFLERVPDKNCHLGYDCISPGSLAKNLIIVGATEKILTNNKKYTQSSDVVKASYSSVGPRDDGAIKPDIAGVGSNVIYAAYDNNTETYQIGNGTSYSTPQVTGIIGLWTEIYKSLFNGKVLNAASAKTLLIHSAQEAGNKGPDVLFGWGFADAQKGAELLVGKKNSKVIFENKTLQNNSTDEIILKSNGSEPLKVTISWIDPSFKEIDSRDNDTPYNNRNRSMLVNDLDLKITNMNTNEVFLPWRLDAHNPLAEATRGDNKVDNVEQVLIENPTAGTYKVVVSHKRNLVNNDSTIAPQDYVILATGYFVEDSIDENPDNQEDNYDGRVGINTEYPKATLDVRAIPIDPQVSTAVAQGVIFPEFTSKERAAFRNVAEGTMIFNKDLKCIEIYKGINIGWGCL